MRAKVLKAANVLGFEYGYGARAAMAKTIQLVIYKRHGKVVADTPFFEYLIRGVSDKVRDMGYLFSISYFYRTEDTREQLIALKSAGCAGIILLATEMKTADFGVFEDLEVPIVLLDGWFPTKRFDAVIIDNQRGAWNAVHYRFTMGHTRIGYLHSSVDIRNFVERRDGYMSALHSIKEIPLDLCKCVIPVGTTLEDAAADMSAYLAENDIPPMAFFADNDIIAAGCIRAFHKAGYRIPEDISVVGFDDMPLCTVLEPQLTTIAVPKGPMGSLAAERLDKHIRRETEGEVIRLSVLPEVVERASVLNLK
jgi:LacI family transcriptional regulator